MPDTFSQIYIQIVFAVKGRENLINNSWKTELHKYIAGIIKGKDQKSIIVNGMPDHIHAFVGLRPAMQISDITRDIKNNSSNFINDHKFVKARLTGRAGKICMVPLWAGGTVHFLPKAFGTHSHIGKVYDYILNQEIHHRRKTFKEEYIGLLEKFEIEYDEKYLFDWYD